MAPSRVLMRCIASVQPRPTPRLLSTACYRSNQSTYPITTCSRPLIGLRPTSPPSPIRKSYSQQSKPPDPPDYLSKGELDIFNKIKAELEPVKLEVQDISGGCGSMYALEIESPKFKGLTVIKQHKLVNSVLADEIKSWHGLQLRTRAA